MRTAPGARKVWPDDTDQLREKCWSAAPQLTPGRNVQGYVPGAMENTWWVGVDRGWAPLRVFYDEPNHLFPPAFPKLTPQTRGTPPTTTPVGSAGLPSPTGAGEVTKLNETARTASKRQLPHVWGAAHKQVFPATRLLVRPVPTQPFEVALSALIRKQLLAFQRREKFLQRLSSHKSSLVL
eukprot:gene9627-biopygen22738